MFEKKAKKIKEELEVKVTTPRFEGDIEEMELAHYIEVDKIQRSLNWHKMDKEKATETLRLLSYLISDIEGKEEEVRRCVYGDMRLAVTYMKFSTFFLSDLVLNEEDINLIKTHVKWYNNKVKEEQYVNAGVALSDLKDILIELRDKKAKLLHIDMGTTEKIAHTPLVIKAKKGSK